jgi:hypothetical protein
MSNSETWRRGQGTRIALDSIVYAFKRGAAPESIQRTFPLLTLEQEIDTYLAQAETGFAAQASALNDAAQMA